MPVLNIAQAIEEPKGTDGMRLGEVNVKKIWKRRSGEREGQNGKFWFSFEDLVITDHGGEATLCLNGCAPAGYLGIMEGDVISIESGPDKNGKLTGLSRDDQEYNGKLYKKIMAKGYCKLTVFKPSGEETVHDQGIWLNKEAEAAGYKTHSEAIPPRTPEKPPPSAEEARHDQRLKKGSDLLAQVKGGAGSPQGPVFCDRVSRIEAAVADFFVMEGIFMGRLAEHDGRFVDEESKLPMTATEAIVRLPESAEFICMGIGGCLNRSSR